MLCERNIARRVFLQLVPGQSPAVRVENSDDVVLSVAIHVIHRHHAATYDAAAIPCERQRMIRPWLVSVDWLLPPAEGIDDIHLPVAVAIAVAVAMRSSITAVGNRMNLPLAGGIRGIRLCITIEALGHI